MGHSDGNVPVDSDQNVPLGLLVQHCPGTLPSRRDIKTKDIEQLAIEVFKNRKKGITFKEMMGRFGVSEMQSQSRLKRCCQSGVLFAPEKHKPQQYYPKCLKAGVTEYLAIRKNVLIQPTGVTCSNHPLSNALEAQKAQNFLDILIRLPFAPINIHKLQLRSSIDKEYYSTLEQEPRPRNRAKIYEERIGNTLTRYTYSPNGTVEIALTCSNNPFKLATEDDVCLIFSFFGQVRDRMLYHLSDPRECVVPSIIDWRLIQCDLNKDIEINDKMQLSLPCIQLRHVGRVFRAYVKLQNEKAACRVEESLKVDLPLTDVLDNIRNPNKGLERKVDYLIELVERALKR